MNVERAQTVLFGTTFALGILFAGEIARMCASFFVPTISGSLSVAAITGVGCILSSVGYLIATGFCARNDRYGDLPQDL
jgi:hypothetical protein